MIDTLRSDIRHAVRALAKNPKLSALVIGTMALGIAATTAVYSVIDGVIARPLPLPAGDRFAQLLRPRNDGKGGDTRITAGTLPSRGTPRVTAPVQEQQEVRQCGMLS